MSVSISSKQEGFRRCGVAHSKAAVEYPAGHWSKAQLAILKAEPMLTVVEIEDAPSRPTATEAIAKVKAAASIEELDELSQGEDRKSVLAAIEARRKELSA